MFIVETKEHKTMQNKSKTIIKVEQWLSRHGNKESDRSEINAKQIQGGKWLCEIELPKIGIRVKSISKSERNALSSAASKAFAVINEFLHCNLNVSETIDSIRSMGIEIGENGEFTSTKLTKKQKERTMDSVSWVKKETYE